MIALFKMLESIGFNIQIAKNGEEGLEKKARLVILDLSACHGD